MTLSKDDFEELLNSDSDLNIQRQSGRRLSIEPSSVDLHLGKYVADVANDDHEIVQVWDETTYPDWIVRREHTPIVWPGQFMLAETDEYVELPAGAVGFLHGRSSVGRLGLFVHNAGLVDGGFDGTLTLELFNAASYPICLKSGMKICQLTVHPHNTAPDVAYSQRNGNKYDGQTGPTPSRLFEDF